MRDEPKTKRRGPPAPLRSPSAKPGDWRENFGHIHASLDIQKRRHSRHARQKQSTLDPSRSTWTKLLHLLHPSRHRPALPCPTQTGTGPPPAQAGAPTVHTDNAGSPPATTPEPARAPSADTTAPPHKHAHAMPAASSNTQPEAGSVNSEKQDLGDSSDLRPRKTDLTFTRPQSMNDKRF